MNNQSTYVIAEAGVNHNRDKNIAKQLIAVAADAGADAIKFQTFRAESLAHKSAQMAAYQANNIGEVRSQQKMLSDLELPLDWHDELKQLAEAKGLDFLSTAFDAASLKFLDDLGVTAHKIPSGEITNGPLLLDFARTNKPLILSTGMSTLGEVERALAIILYGIENQRPPTGMNDIWKNWSCLGSELLSKKITLLHCTSEYPAPYDSVNLSAMETLRAAFSLPVGYSDHTAGVVVPSIAVARGARIIEKHFTLDRAMPGPDHKASLEPGELEQMVRYVRETERVLGSPTKAPCVSELVTRELVRQRLMASSFIKKGQRILSDDILTARADKGMLACELWDVVGSVANKNYSPGDPID